MYTILCSKCWSVKEKKADICKICYDHIGIEVDDFLSNTIQILNKNNCHTTFCCSGHVNDDGRFYIAFDKVYSFKNDLPKLFKIENKEDHIVIRVSDKELEIKRTIPEKIDFVAELNKSIYEWVKKEFPEKQPEVLFFFGDR
ncbi:hypothetical protein EHR02_00035 [Leptospira levettii]|uniref:hypothetical protein n=1 Tax=Leptospira levettii TaxID=2023178 RepID=UPI0010826A05|nr:hypothetical protein [Leptospira levettii]TGM95026.1 hypothetical protein EHR02_00035 [Leptospira levettii]